MPIDPIPVSLLVGALANLQGKPTVDLLTEPSLEEITEEWNRYHDDLKAGRLSFAGIPESHYAAYFGGRIVDHNADFIALQASAAAKAGVHWARLVIHYPSKW